LRGRRRHGNSVSKRRMNNGVERDEASQNV
jgi:hypothetical protein